MHGNVIDNESRASKSTPDVGSDLSITPEGESGRDEWFYEAAQDLLGKDAGLHLHYLTGYPQSTCYAYVAKNPEKRRPPPEHLLRKLCHSEQGEPWLRAFMYGCEAEWWARWQREHQLAALAKSIFDQLGEVVK